MRRLERRRVLDASITSLTLPPVIAEGNFSASATADGFSTLFFDWSLREDGLEIDTENQTGLSGQVKTATFMLPDDSSDHVYELRLRVTDSFQTVDTEIATLDVINVAPMIEVLSATDTIENGFTTLTAHIFDPGIADTFTLEVDWGDGTVEMFSYSAGTTSFSEMHQYLDDDPTGTDSDLYTIKVKLADDDGGEVTDDTTILVSNVAPQIENLAATDADENGSTTLTGDIVDPGTLDTFMLEVDWGDGTVEMFNYAAGTTSFSESHQYLDDDPTNTPDDPYTISVKLVDDDTGEFTDSVTIAVSNVAPVIQNLAADNVDENGFTTLSGDIVDPGTLDTFMLEVDWGDGTVEMFNYAAGTTSFSESHQYLDDDPTATPDDPYTISVRLVDDDTGEFVDSVGIVVSNVAPMINNLAATDVDENGTTTLSGDIFDPGTLDTFTLEVDWGDGSMEMFTYAAGSTSFSEMHQYLDDDPTATLSDPYNISVRLIDDDTGEDTDTVTITVSNVAPIIQEIAATDVDENGFTMLTGQFFDPGTLDTFTLEVDWGDGMVEMFSYSAGSTSFSEMHQYLDDDPTGTPDDPYTISVRLVDDDTGEDSDSVTITVSNVDPVLTLVADQSRLEGQLLDLSGLEGAPSLGTFSDVGTLDTHTATINWGDGSMEAAALVQMAGGGLLGGSHTYADNGTYMVTVMLTDDDGGVHGQHFFVMVDNVAPNLSVVGSQSIDEGSLLSLTNIGTLTDPGFNNDNLENPGGPTVETFDFFIDWDDGTVVSTGGATVDQLGAPGLATAASFDGSHTFADNGTYTVIVRVADDDMSGDFLSGVAGVDFVEMTFTVVVDNVDPILTGLETPKVVNEGQAFVLSSLAGSETFNLGIGLSDPGFDNPLNAGNMMNGGEVAETFTGMTIDWGDGSAATAVSIAERVSGSVGALTTAKFDHLTHTYADNGVYTVAVTFSDDDGDAVTRTFTIEVRNVAPTLTLTGESFVINEGDTLTIPNLGTFTDPGFNNLLNPLQPPDGSRETFTYTINWGDGTAEETMVMPATTVDGSPGVLTTGTLANSHLYADNDSDNIYTITVTLSDDDGGSHTQSLAITVHNVNPTLNPVSATDVEPSGQTTLDLSFLDPGADSFQILVDWGDKLSLPPAERFVVETVHAGPTPAAFTLIHIYTGPPDPTNPSADITITVMIFDDDAQIAGVIEAGISNPESVTISNPGITTTMVAIDTTPDVPRLAAAPPATTNVFIPPQLASTQTLQTTFTRAAGGESAVSADRFLRLCVIRPDGEVEKCYRIDDDALSNLRAFFATLPDNRYRIFVVRPETNSERIVIEVDVRRGQLIDTSDESEGIRDRPPTSETPAGGGPGNPVPLDQNPLLQRLPDQSPPSASIQDAPHDSDTLELIPIPAGGSDAAGAKPASGECGTCAAGLVAAGLVAWSKRVDAALAEGDDRAWRRLRRAGRFGRIFRPQANRIEA